MTTGEHDATTTSAGDGDGAGMPAGGLAVPGEDSSTPSGTPAGPAPTEVDKPEADQADADQAEAAEDVRRFATLEWQMPFWSRDAGDTERLELTPTVQGAVDNGKLVILGEVETVPARRPAPRKRG